MKPTHARAKVAIPLLLAAVVGTGAALVALYPKRPRTPSTPQRAEVGPRPVAQGGPATPRVCMIAIGIDQYGDPEIPACHGAMRDARTVGRWVSETAGWGGRNVLLMDDLGQPKPGSARQDIEDLLPTRANLDWAFKEWLGSRTRPGDIIVVYFAGQAATLPPRPDDPAGAEGRYVLLPIDARRTTLDRTGWSLGEAIDDLAAAGRNPIVCWLDTSPRGRGRGIEEPTKPAPSATAMLRTVVRWPGVAAWLAADGRPAPEAKAVGAHSPFTAALLGALGGTERPRNLHASLDLLNRDEALAGQGFRMLGGIAPDLTLWPEKVRLKSLLSRELLLQRGHAGTITSVAFSADGRRMFTAAQDSTVKVWDAPERRVLRALSYHMVGVTALALRPDGRMLASGDGAGWVRIWDLVEHREVFAGPPHDRGVDRLAFSPDGEHLVALDMDGKGALIAMADPANRVRPLSRQGTGVACAEGRGPVAFALAERDGKVRLLGPDGKLLESLDGPGGIVTGRRVATDGRRVAAGDDEGRLMVHETRAGKPSVLTFKQPVDALAISAPAGLLAVATGGTIRLVALAAEGPTLLDTELPLPDPANLVAASRDGRWLAACTQGGSLLLWRLNDRGQPEPVALETAETTGRTTTFAFSPDGQRLVSGDQDGGLRTWSLPEGNSRPAVPPRRGQVAGLSASGDGRYLLQVTQDWQAQVWDLQEGRGLLTIAGRWTSGVVSPDGATVFLTDQEGGDVVPVERASGLRLGMRFERPEGTRQRFGKLAISRDGQRLAAGSLDGPLACVWDARTGKLSQTIQGHADPHPITAVGFSADGRRLLTAAEDGVAKLWDLGDGTVPASEAAKFTLIDDRTKEPVPITAAQLSPAAPYRVVVGGIAGQIRMWDEGSARPIELGSLDRAVLAAAFTPDGQWLAAAGADKSVWLWSMDRGRRRIRLEPSPQHAEQVNALIAWPDGRTIVSGSDDTTIKFWGLADQALLGTLSAEQGTTDWVAYTPDGLFDCSVGGEKQVAWLDNREILSLEQVYDDFHVFRLADQLRHGIRPKAPPPPPRAPPPRLSIDPPSRPAQQARAADLMIALGEPDLTDVRLYQNGVPVQEAADFRPTPDRRRFVAKVQLRKGLNRFHVMAGRPGATGVEGRSETVEIRCDAADSPGQRHVLALGVSAYDDVDRKLQFADRDAKQLADFLQTAGPQAAGASGLKIILTDREVTEAKVDDAFIRLRDRVKGRPEDTIVVFLAGHADVLNGRFYLLLPTFPFRAVDASKSAQRLARVEPGSVLPYVALYRNIARLGALQRLVVIDACQAEAIGDDPGVRQIQEMIDNGAHRARTAYLLGARRGEPATETSALAHGLMTYAILKGLGQNDLETVSGLSVFADLPNADRDRDGMITTDELHWYTDLTVPRLANQFPMLVQRSGAGGDIKFKPTANLGQAPRLQASDTSFPLLEISPNPEK
jgi:WD40 repeat protein